MEYKSKGKSKVNIPGVNRAQTSSNYSINNAKFNGDTIFLGNQFSVVSSYFKNIYYYFRKIIVLI